MTRGVAHPYELRAEVVAAVLAGMSIVQAAARFNLDKSVVSRWVASGATEQRAQPDLGELIVDLIARHVATISAQLQVAARPEWVEKQPAAELAQLVAVERDTTLRLLAGLFPVEPERPELAGPADTAPGPADDDH